MASRIRYKDRKLGRYRKGVPNRKFAKPKKESKVVGNEAYLEAKWDTTCSACGEIIEKGRSFRWNIKTKESNHVLCD